MGNVGGSSHSSIWKAKTRLLMLKMVYSAQSSGSALPPLPVCWVTIATALSVARTDLWEIPSCRITDVIILQIPAGSFCNGSPVSSTASAHLLAYLLKPWAKPAPGLLNHICVIPLNGFGWQEQLTPPVPDVKKITSSSASAEYVDV